MIPFRETVGVTTFDQNGKRLFEWKAVVCDTEEDYLAFLNSESSLYSYSNSSVDLEVIAAMFGMNIAIFSFGIQGLQPRWSWITPNWEVSSLSEYRRPQGIADLWLYHQDESHYDRLIMRSNASASIGGGSSSNMSLSSTRFQIESLS